MRAGNTEDGARNFMSAVEACAHLRAVEVPLLLHGDTFSSVIKAVAARLEGTHAAYAVAYQDAAHYLRGVGDHLLPHLSSLSVLNQPLCPRMDPPSERNGMDRPLCDAFAYLATCVSLLGTDAPLRRVELFTDAQLSASAADALFSALAKRHVAELVLHTLNEVHVRVLEACGLPPSLLSLTVDGLSTPSCDLENIMHAVEAAPSLSALAFINCKSQDTVVDDYSSPTYATDAPVVRVAHLGSLETFLSSPACTLRSLSVVDCHPLWDSTLIAALWRNTSLRELLHQRQGSGERATPMRRGV